MKISAFFIRLLVYAAVLMGVYGVIAYDTAHGNFAESTYQEDTTFTEYAQETLLLLMIAVCALGARYPVHRHIHVFLIAVATVSFIREFNNLLGDFWKLGVLVVLIPAVWFFYRNFQSLKREFEQVGETYSFAIILMGGLILHVFSRFYGYRTIWMETMEDNYTRAVIRVSEEGIELLAYSIVFIGIVELYRLTRSTQRRMVASNAAHAEKAPSVARNKRSV